MRLAPLCLTTILLSSCSGSEAEPSTATIEQIEAKLAGEPCIGSVGEWHREYAFRKANNKPADRNDIRVWFKAAGPRDAAGRFVRETTDKWPLDDSPVNMVFARYDVRRDQLTLESCGANFGGADQPERIIQ
jgi:hypothetical protein